MDGLFATNQAAFHAVCAHISVYHQGMSRGMEHFMKDHLLREAGIRQSKLDKITFWNVPGLYEQLGKSVPLEIHGNYVFVDEKEVKNPKRRMTYSMLRYSTLLAGIKRADGGQKAYDYVTMNFTLALGAFTGWVFLWRGRTWWQWMHNKPIMAVATSTFVMCTMMPFVRLFFSIIGVGAILHANDNKKALKNLRCLDCLQDCHEFMDRQLVELQDMPVPEAKPGQQPVDPAAWKDQIDMQTVYVDCNRAAVINAINEVLKKHGLSKEDLRLDKAVGDHSKELETVREKLRETKLEKRKRRKEEATGVLSPQVGDKSSKKASLTSASSGEDGEASEGEKPKTLMPDECLCIMHRGLRADPKGFKHPKDFPISQFDRDLAEARGPSRGNMKETIPQTMTFGANIAAGAGEKRELHPELAKKEVKKA